jgi:hypothetical protein
VADSKARGRIDESSSIIRPAMAHRGHHPIKRRLIRASLRIHQPAAYRAHANSLFKIRSSTLPL